MINIRFYTLVTIVLVVSIFRLIPHPPNFTPVMAVALFAGAYFTDRRIAFLLPIVAMVITDIIIGFHASVLFVYVGVLFVVLFGMLLCNSKSVFRVLCVTTASSLVFFVISNFGAWFVMPELYPRSASGLIAAYVAAIPFYQNSLAADLFYVILLFGGFEWAQRSYVVLRKPLLEQAT